jgi:protein-S-isoprenylcysteine O-methyltransferase Ste14
MGLVVFLTVSGLVPATILHDQFGPLLVTVNLLTFAFTAFLYFHGKASERQERVSGNAFYEYFIGNELNPRIGNLDLKLFCEARPGLILWILINMSLAAKQYELHGFLTTPMILVNAFQFLYIADYYYHEEAILTTWDIKHENFGWMLCWGDLVWVPFTYTLQAYYLVHNTHELSWPATIGLIAMNMIGYIIFRGANWQKHKFRKNPQGLVWGKPAEYIRTKHGSLLLTSGWWGMSRHMNYFGDLIMALAWCLPTGFGSPLPYFYITYFTILLVHREYRDNLMCQEKYGKDWDAYSARVRWRIVPGVY